MGKPCLKDENVVAKVKRIEIKLEERGEKTDIRNWLKKNEPANEGSQMKLKEDVRKKTGVVLIDLTEEDEEVGQVEENIDVELVDLTEELTPSENKYVETPTSRKEANNGKVVKQRGPLDEVLSKWMTLKPRDFQTLRGREFLNDRIIDGYMRLIRERNSVDPSLPVIYACMTHLYTGIKLQGFEHTETWVKEDLRTKDIILIPIHDETYVHWSLIVIETSTRTVNYFDSLVQRRAWDPSPRVFKRYIEKHYKDRGETVTFRINRRKDVPYQENGYDCGVFLCQYAERVARRSPLNFNQRDLDLVRARERMTEELLKGRLNPEWRMANWVNVQTNINEIEYKGKRKETVQKVEKIDHRRKKEDNGGKNRVVKSRAKIESRPKEKPKAMK